MGSSIRAGVMDIQRFQGNRSQHWDMALHAATIGIAQNEQIRAQEHPAVCTRQIKKKFTVMQDVSNQVRPGLRVVWVRGMELPIRKHALHDMKKHHTRLPEVASKPRDSYGDRAMHKECRGGWPQTPHRIFYPNLNDTSTSCKSSEKAQEEAEGPRRCPKGRRRLLTSVQPCTRVGWLANT